MGFLFEQGLLQETQKGIDIHGAPSWYEKREDFKNIYVSTFEHGDLSAIDKAKAKAKQKLTVIISNTYDNSIRKYKSTLRNKDELKFIENLKQETNMKYFTNNNLIFKDIKYNYYDRIAYVRAFISIKSLEEYQNKKIAYLKEKILDYQFDNMIKETH